MFRGAFVGLLGGSGLPPADMQEFAGFVRSLRYAPNPNGPRNRVYTGLAAQGRDIYGLNPDVADRYTSYPVTPTLSDAPDQDNDTS